MRKKYSTNIMEIKERLKEERKNAGLTQRKLAEGIHICRSGDNSSGRTTLTNWENLNNQTLPNLLSLIDICNLLEVDMDYILGASNIQSQDIKTIADTTHISQETVRTLQNNPEYGSFLDSFVNDDLLSEISTRIKQLGVNFVLEGVIKTSFTPHFINTIRRTFNNFYFTTFPMDISSEKFVSYLTDKFPYSDKFNPDEFIENNFVDDGKLFVYNNCKNGKDEFYSLHSYEKYKHIISSISEISYDYFMSLQNVELSKQRLNTMLSQIIDNAIEKERKKVEANFTSVTK